MAQTPDRPPNRTEPNRNSQDGQPLGIPPTARCPHTLVSQMAQMAQVAQVAQEDTHQTGFVSISCLGAPELPEPSQRVNYSIDQPLALDELGLAEETAIGEPASPYLHHFERRLCAEVSKLLVEHHERVASCVEKLSEQILASQKLKPFAAKGCKKQENPAENNGNIHTPGQMRRAFSSATASDNTYNSHQDSDIDSEASNQKKARSIGQRHSDQILSPLGHSRCQTFVLGMQFQCICALAIFSNAVLIGWEIEYEAQDPSKKLPAGFTVMSHFYAVFFSLELLLRIAAQGKEFLGREDLVWNLTDMFIVLGAVLESVVQLMIPEENSNINFVGRVSSMRIIRIIRVLRVARVMRVSRLVRYVASLRTLIYSIATTLKDLFWTVFLLTMIIYIAAILFTEAFIDNYTRDYTGDIQKWWGSLARSMLTLYKIISGGVSWHDPAEPLELVGIGWVMLLVVYVFFTYFAVLNVITGIFCNSAIETAARNPDLIAQSLLANRKQLEDRLKKLFVLIDNDGTGEITLEELELLLQDEEMQAYFEAVGLDSQDAWTLFRLIDEDKTHTIEIDEFISGVMRLKGEARSIDVALLISDVKRVLRKIAEVLRRTSPSKDS